MRRAFVVVLFAPLLTTCDTAPPTPAPDFALVRTGWLYTCARTEDGQGWCWGSNSAGQLGDGSRTQRLAPVRVQGSLAFADISPDTLHTCGTTDSGTWCWGDNYRGELGTGDPPGLSLTPTAVVGGPSLYSVSAGGSYTCALTIANAAWCWGDNLYGQLGNAAATGFSAIPVAVAGGHAFYAISAGMGPATSHTCAIAGDGAWCWGSNGHGQLGNGSKAGGSTPVAVAGGVLFGQISAGGSHTCGVTSASVLYCWGSNAQGQLGIGTTGGDSLVPVVAGGRFLSYVTAGWFHTCALYNGDAYCWGANFNGQLGDGSLTSSPVPVLVAGQHVFSWLSAGANHTCGVALGPAGKTVYCWGANDAGQLGTGNTTPSTVPVAITITP